MCATLTLFEIKDKRQKREAKCKRSKDIIKQRSTWSLSNADDVDKLAPVNSKGHQSDFHQNKNYNIENMCF